MQSFISQVVKEIINSKIKLEKQYIIVPSQRSIVLLRNEFIAQLNENTWLPKIITLDELFLEISDLKLVSNVELIFQFYSSYLKVKKATKGKVEDFESVSKWGNIVLSDFDEIDRYLVDTKAFFDNLREVKRIEKWNPEQNDSLADKYLEFWFDLEPLYNQFKVDLLENSTAYGGLALREACSKISAYTEGLKGEKFFNFVGFNALSKGELFLFNNILDSKIGRTFWDSDSYYMDDSIQEAGMFLRRHLNDIKSLNPSNFNWVYDNFLDEKNIKVIGVASKVGQSRLSGQILYDLQKENKISKDKINTAVVLADENLLLPSLNSIPKEIEHVNVTMGYPLYLSSFASLFENFIYLHERHQKQKGFYYKDVLLLLKNPLLKNLSRDFQKEVEFLINSIIRENKIYINYNYLESKNINNTILEIFESWGESVVIGIKNIVKLINNLKHHLLEDYSKNKLELDQLFKFSKVFNQIQLFSLKYNFFENIKSLKSLYTQILRKEKFSFIGEPLKGLQLMGVLETRLMDFENVIITSLNEGTLPTGSYTNTFMPYDIKLEFGMPSNSDKDAIYSYHFYRLIQRAKNIYLIYNNESKGLNSSDSSRYIKQLIRENAEKHNIEELVYSGNEFNLKAPGTSIEKDEFFKEKLSHYAFEKGFSPSSLATYLYNPLEFYFQRILGIKEEDEVEETADFTTIGNAIHECLEEIYKPFVGVELKIENIDLNRNQIEEKLKRSFDRVYKNGDLSTGKNNLMFNVAIEFIHSFLKFEQNELKKGKKIEIVSLENEYEVPLRISKLNSEVKIKGKIDRIDRVNGHLRILDYKTGKADAKSLSVKNFDEIFNLDKPKTKMLQVMIYSMFAFKSNDISLSKDEKITSGLIALKNSSNMILQTKIGTKDYVEFSDIAEFEKHLEEMIWSIFDPSQAIEEKITTTYD